MMKWGKEYASFSNCLICCDMGYGVTGLFGAFVKKVDGLFLLPE